MSPDARLKRSPVSDVSALLRSLGRAGAAAIERTGDPKAPKPLERDWETGARAAFLNGYRERIQGSAAWPAAPGEAERLIAIFAVRGACREGRELLESRPDRAARPLAGLLRLIDGLVEPGAGVGVAGAA
jgi:predicted trehalose synthase